MEKVFKKIIGNLELRRLGRRRKENKETSFA
jgi:hypothetical protein